MPKPTPDQIRQMTKGKTYDGPPSPSQARGSRLVAKAFRQEMPETTFVSVGVDATPEGWKENDPAPVLDPSEKTRLFYHFTGHLYVQAITEYGIAKGDVPITPTGGFCAPCLTEDPRWDYQTWSPGTGVSRVDKLEVRFTVRIPWGDDALWHWPRLARAEDMEPYWYETINTLHGTQPDNSASWWVYKGRIPPEWITARHYRKEAKGLRGSGKSLRAPFAGSPS